MQDLVDERTFIEHSLCLRSYNLQERQVKVNNIKKTHKRLLKKGRQTYGAYKKKTRLNP